MFTYAELIDSGNAGRVPELFADDGVFEIAGQAPVEGRVALAESFARRQALDRRSRHVITNPLVDVLAPDAATGSCAVLVFNADGVPEGEVGPLDGARVVGRYVDSYRRTFDGWRIASRRLHIDFRPPVTPGV